MQGNMIQTKLKKNMTICFLSITFFTFKEKNLNLRTQWKIKWLEKNVHLLHPFKQKFYQLNREIISSASV